MELLTFEPDIHDEISEICLAIAERGMDPVRQIMGYLLTEDPGYITSHNDARKRITKLDRDEIMTDIVKAYLFEN